MSSKRRNIFILLLVLGLLIASGVVILTKSAKLGLDLKGGVELVYQGEPTPQSKVTPEAVDRAIEIIRQRVDVLGVSEPEIQRSGSDQITIGLPDVSNAQRAINQVGKTAQLYFYDWEKNVVGDPNKPIDGLYKAVEKASKRKAKDYGTTTGAQYYLFDKKSKKLLVGPDTSEEDLLAEYDGKQPAGSVLLTVPRGTSVVRAEKPEKATKAPDQWFILDDRPELKGSDIKSPEQGFDSQSNQPNVNFQFTGEGRKKFHEVTRRIAQRGASEALPGQPIQATAQHFAIVLDNEVVSRPFIDYNQNPDGIDGSTGAEISGGFTIQGAQDLAQFLKIGALPIDLNLISQRQVSASLGQQALDQGLIAGLIGLAIVMLYLVFFYRILGVIADLALIVYAIFFYAVALLIPITLTLPGIAGLILTIGVAADANIVIFERIKEEARLGRSVPAAISAGYSKGLRTIIDGNAVTFITAFILFILATAGVKGFAFTLGVGIIISMFTAVLATQAILGTMGNTRLLGRPSALGAGKQRVRWNFDFIGSSKWFFSISGVIHLIGAVAFATKGINAGIDFKGGTRITVSVAKNATEAQVQEAVSKFGASDAKVQKLNDPELGKNVFQISSQELKTGDVGQLEKQIDQDFTTEANGFSSESIGPTFGDEVKRSAIYAIIFSLLAVVLYVTWRFQFKFAVPAVIALFHDLLIAFGVYSVTGRTVSTATVAALLTILGYSLYDTVIVFDRIRENEPRMPGAAFSQIVNRSMSDVLTRSLNTSIVTLIPVLVLLFFGGETLKDFAFALFVGILSGAYSSIFIASPVLTAWKEREEIYKRRREQIAKLFNGVVPAFATAGASAGFEVEAPEPLTVPEPVSASESVVYEEEVDGDLASDQPDPSVESETDIGDVGAEETGPQATPKPKKEKKPKQAKRRKKHGRR